MWNVSSKTIQSSWFSTCLSAPPLAIADVWAQYFDWDMEEITLMVFVYQLCFHFDDHKCQGHFAIFKYKLFYIKIDFKRAAALIKTLSTHQQKLIKWLNLLLILSQMDVFHYMCWKNSDCIFSINWVLCHSLLKSRAQWYCDGPFLYLLLVHSENGCDTFTYCWQFVGIWLCFAWKSWVWGDDDLINLLNALCLHSCWWELDPPLNLILNSAFIHWVGRLNVVCKSFL